MSERVGCSAYLARSSRSTHTHTHRVSIFPSLRQCLVATAVTVSEILQLYHLLPSPPPLLSLRPIKLTRVSAYTSERRYFSSQVPPTYQSQLYLPLLPIVFVPLLCVCVTAASILSAVCCSSPKIWCSLEETEQKNPHYRKDAHLSSASFPEPSGSIGCPCR